MLIKNKRYLRVQRTRISKLGTLEHNLDIFIRFYVLNFTQYCKNMHKKLVFPLFLTKYTI
jgi:hypothetical protein